LKGTEEGEKKKKIVGRREGWVERPPWGTENPNHRQGKKRGTGPQKLRTEGRIKERGGKSLTRERGKI